VNNTEVYELIKCARDTVKEWARPSPKTCSRYKEALASLQKSDINIIDWLRLAKCSRTYYYRRAAINYVFREELTIALRLRDAAIRQSEHAGVGEQIARIKNFVRLLAQIPADPEHLKFKSKTKGEFAALNEATPRRKERKIGKRESLRRANPDWIEKIWQFAMNSRYADHIAVLALTGCRPSELQKGIYIKLGQWHQMSVYIAGSKVNDFNGQDWRILHFDDLKTPWGKHLLDKVWRNNRELSLCLEEPKPGKKTGETKFITDMLRHWSVELGWTDRKSVSAYTFRHAASAQFKNYLSPYDVAAALGQRQVNTQRDYGLRAQAKGLADIPTKIEAKHAVRGVVAKFDPNIKAVIRNASFSRKKPIFSSGPKLSEMGPE
jgi:integrase